MDVDYTRYSPGQELGARIGAVPMTACLACGRTCNAKGGRSKRYVHAVRIYRKTTLPFDRPGRVCNALEVMSQCKLNEKQIQLLAEIDLHALNGEHLTELALACALYGVDVGDACDVSKQQAKATAKLLAQLVGMGALERTTDRVPRYRRPEQVLARFAARKAA